jgi:hybrid cluster-associated redox disulfide protein
MPEKKITKDMTLGDLVERYPQAAMLLAKKGMHCIGCSMSAWETIAQGCKTHGMSDEEIEKLLKEMNETRAKKK